MDRVLAMAFVVVSVSGAVGGQSISTDEKAIRDLIAAGDAGEPLPETSDSIFWSGLYKKPRVRGTGDKPEMVAGNADRISGGTTKTTVRRIEVARSGDLAYEFSDGNLVEQFKGGKTENSTISILRVWKKVGGQWLVAARLSRTHED